MSNRWKLQDKQALVTGGTKGIGLAIVRELLDLGAEVIGVSGDRVEGLKYFKLAHNLNFSLLSLCSTV